VPRATVGDEERVQAMNLPSGWIDALLHRLIEYM
jgi:hypothetical protein